MNFRTVVFLLSVFYIFSIFVSAQTSIRDLKPIHAEVLNKWLAAHPGWRLALEKDYNQQRLNDYKTAEKSLPFYSSKDFNRDRREDFAAILTKGGKFSVIVFNSPLSSPKPAFYSAEIERDDVLYFNKNTQRLIVGPYESDAGFQLIPAGRIYKAKGF